LVRVQQKTELYLGQTHFFNFSPVTEKEVEKIIMSFDNKYSSGYDEIPIVVIKYALPHIIKPLTHVINSSLICGKFPENLKVARVIPIFKKGNREDVTCYRPVSLLPVFSKIIEKVVYKQFVFFLKIINYLKNNNMALEQTNQP